MTRVEYVPVVPTSVFTSPAIVVWFFNFTEQPKSPSFKTPLEVKKILAPEINSSHIISHVLTFVLLNLTLYFDPKISHLRLTFPFKDNYQGESSKFPKS